jgi:hypothetical protein
MELVRKVVPPKAVPGGHGDGRRAIAVEVACRVLDVSTSGYDAWRSRPLSARAIRHARFTDRIAESEPGGDTCRVMHPTVGTWLNCEPMGADSIDQRWRMTGGNRPCGAPLGAVCMVLIRIEAQKHPHHRPTEIRRAARGAGRVRFTNDQRPAQALLDQPPASIRTQRGHRHVGFGRPRREAFTAGFAVASGSTKPTYR